MKDYRVHNAGADTVYINGFPLLAGGAMIVPGPTKPTVAPADADRVYITDFGLPAERINMKEQK